MILNYIKSAFRNIARHKGYSLINIVGLAVGIISSLAVLLWVLDEISYDRFHTNASSIYRCYRQLVWNGETRFSESSAIPLGPAVKEGTPGIDEQVRVLFYYQKLQYEKESIYKGGMYVDPSFLRLFTFPLLKGDPESALDAPNSIILTEKTARGLFGEQDPMGETLESGLIVTGIAENVRHTSSLHFDFLIPIAYAGQTGLVSNDEWWDFCCDTYFLLHKDAKPNDVGLLIKDFYTSIDSEAEIELHLQALTDIHLKGLEGTRRIVYVYVFSIVAFLLLAVACINFMNLATARASKRAKEIALRKTVGADRLQLIYQIMIESAIQTVAGVFLGICMLELALPTLTELFGKKLALVMSGEIFLILAGITFLTAMAAGSYPALVLSSFKPASVLKTNKSGNGNKSMNLVRKALVVFQFTISIGLIFMALVIYGQLNHIDNMDLGIDTENIVTIYAEGLDQDYAAVKNELLKYSGIQGVSAVYEPPAWCGWYTVGFDFEGKEEGKDIRSGVAWIDNDYIDVFGLELVEGRNFSQQYPSDETNAYIVNEAAVQAMHMDSPVGKSLDAGDRPGEIIGVVKDFHFSSLHQGIGPLILGMDKSSFRRLCIKISPEDIQGGLGYIEKTWNKFRSGDLFKYRFFEDLLDREYRAENRIGRIVLAFTVVTVLVACLGLFGLAAYSAERRTKEIGIRKVLGSSIAGIVKQLTREFVFYVIFGTILATPIAYYIASHWLESFAYRIDLSWELPVFAGGLAIIIAIATVSYHAIKAARANPVDALKYE
jgi:hypothetical protein